MIKDIVEVAGAVVRRSDEGVYAVLAWWRNQGGGRMHETVYERLSWTEACDVVLSELDAHRPGLPAGQAWQQLELWSGATVPPSPATSSGASGDAG